MATETIEISVRVDTGGADCLACSDRLRGELAGHRGLLAVEPAGPAALRVTYDPDLCSLSSVGSAADAIGVGLGRRFGHRVVAIEGVDSAEGARTIERAVARLEGVTACSVDFAAARLRVEYAAGAGDGIDARVAHRVAALGSRVADPAAGEPGLTGGARSTEGESPA